MRLWRRVLLVSFAVMSYDLPHLAQLEPSPPTVAAFPRGALPEKVRTLRLSFW